MPPEIDEHQSKSRASDSQSSSATHEAWDNMCRFPEHVASKHNEDRIQTLTFDSPFPAAPGDKQLDQKTDFLWGKRGNDPLAAITPDAIKQGGLGDCYFLASLASLANEQPQAIKDMIKDNGNNTFTVTFPGDPERPVTVDKPTEAELNQYAHGGPNGAWVNVIEKAHRKYTGRETSDSGDDPEKAIRLLTPPGTGTVDDDLSGKILRIGRTSEENLEKDLKTALNNDRLIVASTTDDDWLRTHLGGANDPGALVETHTFTVLGYDDKSKVVTIRNPWGGESGTSGTFNMSLDEFYNRFENLQFATA